MDQNIKNILILFGIISFFSVYKSLKFLRKGTKSYYPFDVFIPESGFWSVMLYLAIVIFFSICVYIVFKFDLKFYRS